MSSEESYKRQGELKVFTTPNGQERFMVTPQVMDIWEEMRRKTESIRAEQGSHATSGAQEQDDELGRIKTRLYDQFIADNEGCQLSQEMFLKSMERLSSPI